MIGRNYIYEQNKKYYCNCHFNNFLVSDVLDNRQPNTMASFFFYRQGRWSKCFLGDIPSENYDRMGFTKGLIEYIVSKNAWLVGTDRGELFLFDNSGKQIWKRSLGIGKLVSLCVSHDEKLLL